MHATLGVYGEGWIRTTKGSMLIDFDEVVLKRREVQVIYTDIARALHEGVSNRGNHEKWMSTCRIQKCIDRGVEAHKVATQADAHARFLKSLHERRDTEASLPEAQRTSPMVAIRMGVQLAAAAKEEHDMQKAIAASLGEEKTPS
jgi:hypothetical protein